MKQRTLRAALMTAVLVGASLPASAQSTPWEDRVFVNLSFGVDTGTTEIAQSGTLPDLIYGEPATFQVTASGTPTLSYQWLRNGVDIPGATSRTYTIAAATPADDSTFYRARVSNSLGSATSLSAPADEMSWHGIRGSGVPSHAPC